MKGKDFLQKVKRLDGWIATFTASISMKDGGKLALACSQQEEIAAFLEEYKNMLLENEIK